MNLENFNSLIELFFYQSEKQDPKSIFLQWLNPNNKKNFTWEETKINIFKLSKTIKNNVKEGDRCLLVSENRPEWFISDLAIMLSGAITVPAYTTYTEEDYKYLIEDCEPTVVIVSNNDMLKKLNKIINEKNFIKKVITFDEIEKAHHNTITSLLTLLSDFEAKDNSSLRMVDFSQCIFIFTSNLGQTPSTNNDGIPVDFQSVLANDLPPEFISRIGRGYIAHCKMLAPNKLIQFVDDVSDEFVRNTEYCLASNLPRAIANMAGSLNPRSILGQASKLAAIIAKELDEVADDFDNEVVNVDFIFPSNDSSYTDFINQNHTRCWQSKFSVKTYSEENKVNINITFDDIKPLIQHEDTMLPFLNFIENSTSTFKEVVGQNESIGVLTNMVDKMNELKPNEQIGNLPKGILLSGSPGTGKTHLARAVANRYRGIFIQVNASELTIGDTDKNIKSLFDIAQKYAPSIIFIDEIETITATRQSGKLGHNLMVNSILTRLDGFDQSSSQVVVIGATNNHNVIDPAVTRPGRLAQLIELSYPR